MEEKIPIFLKIEDFEKIKKSIEMLNEKTEETETAIKELRQMNLEEQKNLESFENEIKKIRKVVDSLTLKVTKPRDE
ncbi:MAG TPA: hypothetical protein ENN46_00285 [Candidatus Woesearchaeota archaeon]|nr:hypothetical protein [Candidatus Woesearchaeota archaeon]